MSVRCRRLRHELPRLRARYKPLTFASLPTPVESCPGLAELWSLDGLWVKRDDLTSPTYGGTKVRALEWLLGEARASGARSVLTVGPWGSHHALATAIFARAVGLDARLVLFPDVERPSAAANRIRLPSLATEVSFAESWAAVPASWLRARRRTDGRRPYGIAAGGTSPLGILGAAEGALEVADAVRDGLLPCPDDVLVPAGSCGTAAGLLLGFSLTDLPVRVVAVRVVPRLVARPGRVRRLARRGFRILRAAGWARERRSIPLLWVGDQAGRGYGVTTAAAEAVLGTMREVGGHRIETTYTAKALAVAPAGLLRGRRVLFWNTYSAVDPEMPG